MWVNIYGDNTDFIALGVIVITYINSVGLLLFFNFGPTSRWLLVWILLSTGGALASHVPLANFATLSPCRVLGRAGGSARCMGLSAIPA